MQLVTCGVTMSQALQLTLNIKWHKKTVIIYSKTINKHIFSIHIYKSLLINVSVSFIVSEVLLHITLHRVSVVNDEINHLGFLFEDFC